MNHTLLILLILYEVISVVWIYRLWTRKQRPGVIERCVLSVIVLVPFLRWIFYGFLGVSPPDSHGDDIPHRYGDGSLGPH